MADFSDREFAGDDISIDDLPIDQDNHEELRRIGDVAKEFGVSLRTLRFYEDKGLISPLRAGSARLYRRRDLSRLKLIMLGRKVGFTLREVKFMMDLYDPSGSNFRQMKTVMERSVKQLGRLEKQREELNEAIDALNGVIHDVRLQLDDYASRKAS